MLTYSLAAYNGIVRLIRFPVTHVIPGRDPDVVGRALSQIRQLNVQVFRGTDLNTLKNHSRLTITFIFVQFIELNYSSHKYLPFSMLFCPLL